MRRLHSYVPVDATEHFCVPRQEVEPNNTVLNLIAKARMVEYQGFLISFQREMDASTSRCSVSSSGE